MLSAIAGGAGAHDRGLGEDARAAVGVRALAGVDGGECDAVLIILAQVEAARKPALDAPVPPHGINELPAVLLIRMIEPAAPVHDVVLLNDSNPAPVRRGVREDEDPPPRAVAQDPEGAFVVDQTFY